ncbi:MAG TPA: DNA polymerase III subunit delta [Halanaerobiales bacterium]|nr:DNA polymerase III subunit delta [Halanaerobiales bacterium]
MEKILNSSSEKLKPVYLLYGEETYLLDDFKERFIERFITDKVGDFNFTLLEETEDFAVNLKNQANTPPFMGSRRYIITRTNEFFVVKKEGNELLINLFRNFPDTTTLLIIVNGKINGRIKPVKELKKIGEIIEVSAPRYADLEKWINNEFSKRGKSADKRVIKLLEAAFSNKLQILESEIEKICLYKGDEREVSSEDIRRVISKDKVVEDNFIFELTDALVASNSGKAINVLNELLNNGASPLPIISTIIWQIKLFLSVKVLKNEGKKIPEIARKLKVHPYPVEKSYGKTDNFSEEQLELMLDRFLRANYNIVSGKMESEIALEKAILGR